LCINIHKNNDLILQELLQKKQGMHESSRYALCFHSGKYRTSHKDPAWNELFFLFLLGTGANLIQVCLFRAFAATDASSLAPFRYVDLVFSIIFSVILFNEFPTLHTMIEDSITGSQPSLGQALPALCI
jgi:glucose uptake protein GlcU